MPSVVTILAIALAVVVGAAGTGIFCLWWRKRNRHQIMERFRHPFSLDSNIQSNFENIDRGLNRTMLVYDNRRKLRRLILLVNPRFVEWRLLDLSLNDEPSAVRWLMSISYRISFRSIFELMRSEGAKEAIFFSHMNSKVWKERYQMEATDDQDIRRYVQLRPERDTHYSKNLRWEHEVLTALKGGLPITQYRMILNSDEDEKSVRHVNDGKVSRSVSRVSAPGDFKQHELKRKPNLVKSFSQTTDRSVTKPEADVSECDQDSKGKEVLDLAGPHMHLSVLPSSKGSIPLYTPSHSYSVQPEDSPSQVPVQNEQNVQASEKSDPIIPTSCIDKNPIQSEQDAGSCRSDVAADYSPERIFHKRKFKLKQAQTAQVCPLEFGADQSPENNIYKSSMKRASSMYSSGSSLEVPIIFPNSKTTRTSSSPRSKPKVLVHGISPSHSLDTNSDRKSSKHFKSSTLTSTKSSTSNIVGEIRLDIMDI